MPKEKGERRSPTTPRKRPAKRSPQEVYDYWTEEMMAAAEPLELERERPRAGKQNRQKEKDDGERGCS